MSITTPRTAVTGTPILDVLAERWSPRAFDSSAPLDETKLRAALEAARWSASASNSQPWRFIVARKGSEAFAKVEAALMGFNSAWAGSAGALIVALTETVDQDGKPRRWAEYDLGQAMAHLSVQAHSDGLHVHQMGGFVADALREAFDVPAELTPLSVSAIGVLGSPDLLADSARERETAPRTRRPLAESLLVDE